MSKAFRWWAIKRRIIYGSGFSGFWILVAVAIYYFNFYIPPSCFDLEYNGKERGVDCGGKCVAICAPNVIPPRTQWVKAFEIAPGQYNVVAYIENPNQIAATDNLQYHFKLFDERGVELAERQGVTALPPNSIHPIFAGRVFVPNGAKVASSTIELNHLAKSWQPATIMANQFRTIDFNFENADITPRLEVTIENTSIESENNLEVVATVFNDDGTPVTASQTNIDQIGSRETKDIIFTWPTTIAKTIKSCDLPTDIVVAIDLSGSMNNDGGNPPEPITSSLAAAAGFVGRMKDDDQTAVVTFATDSAIPVELSNVTAVIKDTINSLKINLNEERGFTNTAAALLAAQNELGSARHNPNARRVVVLLTDGMPTAAGEKDAAAEATSMAAQLAASNIEIYAIGLGKEVDKEFITDIATEPGNAFIAPEVEGLGRIYEKINTSICESGPPKIEVIPRVSPDFVPLR